MAHVSRRIAGIFNSLLTAHPAAPNIAQHEEPWACDLVASPGCLAQEFQA
jgi:hypothetical protein